MAKPSVTVSTAHRWCASTPRALIRSATDMNWCYRPAGHSMRSSRDRTAISCMRPCCRRTKIQYLVRKPNQAGSSTMNSQVHYLPLPPALFSVLVFLFIGLIILIQLRILRYAYMKLGVGPGAALLLLFGSLIGSYFNIPVTILPGPLVRSGEIVDYFGMQYVVPLVTSWP